MNNEAFLDSEHVRVCFNKFKMFFFFAISSFSVSYVLNETTKPLFFDPSKIPIFVEIWDQWCPHCRHFRPQWEQLTDDPRFKDKILFLAANCGSSRSKFCKMFPGDETPRFFYFDNGQSDARPYSGSPQYEEISTFLSQQLNGPFVELHYTDDFNAVTQEIQKYHEKNKKNQILLFNISEDDEFSFNIASAAVDKVRHLPITFFLFKDRKSSHEPIISVQGRNIDYFDTTKQDFTEENIVKYIKQKSLPFLSIFTDMSLYYSSQNHIAVAAFVLPQKKGAGANLKPYAEALNNYFPTLQTTCDISRSLCNYVNEKPKNDGFIAIVNRSERYFWVYKKEYTIDGINKWAKGILDKTVKPYGPGPGKIGFVLNVYYTLRERGGLPYYIIHIPIFIMIILILVLIWALADAVIFRIRLKKAEKEMKRRLKKE